MHGMQEVSGSIPLFSTKKALYFVGSTVLFFLLKLFFGGCIASPAPFLGFCRRFLYNPQLLTLHRVMDRGQLVGVLGTFHFMGSVGQRREEHGLCGICGKQQPATLAVHYLCSAHSGLYTALLRHKVLCHVVCDLVLVNAQLCTMLAVPVGLRRAVSVPLHRVVIGVDLEQHTESVFSKPGMALV